MQRVVGSSVLVVLLESSTHLESEVWGYSDVTIIEKAVQVSSEQQTVGNIVLATFRVWDYVRCLKYWSRVLSGD